ncbi:MAG TPA: hypothetical protein VKV26_10885 [Dehalococcoidia bacterium]|nr:hypothetical protein [Dehalococcoidia bacterium]
MLRGLLIVLIVLVAVFAILTFAVHHLFLIGLIIAAVFLIGHSGFLARRRS